MRRSARVCGRAATLDTILSLCAKQINRRPANTLASFTNGSRLSASTHRHGTHSMRRTKAAQIYKKTGNLRAVQLLLGHTKLESTVRYLGIEVDDAVKIAEQVELEDTSTVASPRSLSRQ